MVGSRAVELGTQPFFLGGSCGAAVAGMPGGEIVAVGVEHDHAPASAGRIEGVITQAVRGASWLIR